MVIDHIGIVVGSLEAGIRQWETMFGYKPNSTVVVNTRQKVRVVFLAKAGSMTVKLVQPVDAGSPVAAFARRGGGLHHLCFRCDNLESRLKELQDRGVALLVPPEPGEAFNNNKIAFFFAGNNLNVELIDTLEKQGWAGQRPGHATGES